MSRRRIVLAAMVLLGVTGCDWVFGIEHPDSYFRAEISKAVQSSSDNLPGEGVEVRQYEGPANFKAQGPEGPLPGRLESYSIRSENRLNYHDGQVGEGFSFHKYGGDGQPEEGTFRFTHLPFDEARSRAPSLYGTYWIVRPDSVVEFYFVDEGELSIHMVDDEFVLGEFQFTGARWCVFPDPEGTEEQNYCNEAFVDSSVLPSDLPRTEVTGEFLATVAEPTVIHIRD